ncbi:hypothetical protein [Verrucosispora sp. WMMD573]|uniref:hypothetical protein n=1 Tax=Verrucosispora sp. WMMD573 TaxID=3015149 RepID=UPI00248C15E9|nr:hypothetical protein [Verrucosispora sp. WMMD573]WBB54339.1 hypothetical protein O7601_28095 [Verrucosispora sp. WMMD573]
MEPRAWRYRFEEVPWRDIEVRFRDLVRRYPDFQHMADIVESVITCDGAARLAALTSMHDLVVAARPVPDEPPIEVVVVRSPSSGRVGPDGVLIEHRTVSGRDDVITRPSADAVPLFWRFMIEKFGVAPMR